MFVRSPALTIYPPFSNHHGIKHKDQIRSPNKFKVLLSAKSVSELSSGRLFLRTARSSSRVHGAGSTKGLWPARGIPSHRSIPLFKAASGQPMPADTQPIGSLFGVRGPQRGLNGNPTNLTGRTCGLPAQPQLRFRSAPAEDGRGHTPVDLQARQDHLPTDGLLLKSLMKGYTPNHRRIATMVQGQHPDSKTAEGLYVRLHFGNQRGHSYRSRRY